LARRSAIGFALVFYAMILQSAVPPDRFIWVVLPWLALTWTVELSSSGALATRGDSHRVTLRPVVGG